MSKKQYQGVITTSDENKELLKRIFVNHILVYNYALKRLTNKPDTRYEVLVRNTLRYAKETKIKPLLNIAIHVELYYQYRKFNRSVKVQKHFTDLQYLTYTGTSLSNNVFEFVGKDVLRLKEMDIEFKLEVPIGNIRISKGKLLYINISYSPSEDKFMLAIHG